MHVPRDSVRHRPQCHPEVLRRTPRPSRKQREEREVLRSTSESMLKSTDASARLPESSARVGNPCHRCAVRGTGFQPVCPGTPGRRPRSGRNERAQAIFFFPTVEIACALQSRPEYRPTRRSTAATGWKPVPRERRRPPPPAPTASGPTNPSGRGGGGTPPGSPAVRGAPRLRRFQPTASCIASHRGHRNAPVRPGRA